MTRAPILEAENPLVTQFSASLDALLAPVSTPSPMLPCRHLAVAVSGGADSMALTLLAKQYTQTHGGNVIALTVDHGLRAASTEEAAQVAAWMRDQAITHHILTPPHRNVSRNLQAAARTWRYDALADFCRAHGLLHCLIAHHAGDNRETVLLQTERGKTVDGTSGMPAIRPYRGVRFLRPLLGVERSSLEAFLNLHHTRWIEDPSNQNPAFARVRIRQQLAQTPQQEAALDRDIHHNAAARRERDEQLAEAAMRWVTVSPLGYATIAMAGWRNVPPDLAQRLLADSIRTISGATHRPRMGDIARLSHALATNAFIKRTLQRCEISLRGDSLRIARESGRVADPVLLRGQGTLIWDHRFRVHYTLPDSLTYMLRPLGHEGKKQLRAMLNDRALNDLPVSSPSIWHLDQLCFVPHITPSSLPITVGFAPPKPLASAPFW